MKKENSIISLLNQSPAKVFVMYAMLSFLSYLSFSQDYTISTFDKSFCTALPTAYESGTFSIVSTANNVFRKGQGGKTMVFTLSPEFEFNTGVVPIIAVTGTYINTESATYDNANQLTITYTTDNINATDGISLTVQVRAISAGTGYIYRSGGNAQINASDAVPATTEYFGTYSVGDAVMDAGDAVRNDASDVDQFSTSQEMLERAFSEE